MPLDVLKTNVECQKVKKNIGRSNVPELNHGKIHRKPLCVPGKTLVSGICSLYQIQKWRMNHGTCWFP